MLTGAAVQAERTRRKLSRSKFAELVGLTPTKISNIEHGRVIKSDELELLLRYVSPQSREPITVLLDDDEEAIFVYHIEPPLPIPPPPPPPPPPDPIVVATPVTPASAVVVTATPVATPTVPTTPGPVGVAALRVDGLRRISNSEIQTFKHCRRRWWLGWYRGLRLKREPQTGPMPLGTRVHQALAAYYVPEGQVPTDPRAALESVLADDELRLVESLSDSDTQEAATVLTDFKKDADVARAMIEGYVEWLAETGADAGYRVVAPEQVLTAVLRTPGVHPDVLLAGRLDLRLRREHDGAHLFLDHKTTANFEKLVRLLLWDEQLRQYQLLEVANRPEGAPPVVGALYNMLRKVKRSATANPPFYQRVEIHHSVQELKNFKQRLIGESEQILQVEDALDHGVLSHQHVAYPSPSERCVWGCEFSAVCPMFDDGSRAEDFITEYYVQINPLDRYDDEIDEIGD